MRRLSAPLVVLFIGCLPHACASSGSDPDDSGVMVRDGNDQPDGAGDSGGTADSPGDQDPCLGVDCSDHGRCVVSGAAAECQCDEGYEPEGLECVEGYCLCWENNRPHGSSCSFVQSCQSADDCCPDGNTEPFVCNRDFPYIYECHQGYCRTAYCRQDSDCDLYFETYYASQSGSFRNDGCREITNICTGELSTAYCAIEQLCTTADDCCSSVPDPFVCNQDYPYVFACEQGICEEVRCAGDASCDKYLDQLSDTGWISQGCQEIVALCDDEVSYTDCIYKRTCSSPADCCPDSSITPYECNLDFPFIYDCLDGFCVQQYCSEEAQCDKAFDSFYPESEGWINQGCVEY